MGRFGDENLFAVCCRGSGPESGARSGPAGCSSVDLNNSGGVPRLPSAATGSALTTCLNVSFYYSMTYMHLFSAGGSLALPEFHYRGVVQVLLRSRFDRRVCRIRRCGRWELDASLFGQ